MKTNNKPNVIGCKEAAHTLNVTEQYVRLLIDSNQLNATKVGNTWAIDSKSVNNYIKKNKRSSFVPDHARTSKEIPPIVALSFFSGAMGLDLGMEPELPRKLYA